MAERHLDPDASGSLRSVRVATGESHTFVVRRLELDHRYHDEDPVREAPFVVRFPNGLEIAGKLDGQGKAALVGVPARGEVRYEPDQRGFERVDTGPNPDHREVTTEADIEALFAKHGA